MVKSERKQREYQRREEEIIEAAMSLFRARDLHAVTVEQIAEAAEIGKGTVYKHFQSKDEIYARIIIEVIWEHDMRDTQFLRRLNHHMMSSAFLQNLGPQMQQALNELQQEESTFYMQLLSEAQQGGDIVDEPLEDLLFCVTAAINGAILHYWQLEAGGAVGPQEHGRYLRQLQRFVYRALSQTQCDD